jgi:dihydroorotase
MSILLKNAQIVEGDQILAAQDIYINQGKIADIGTDLPTPKGATVVSHPQMYVSAGWMDMGTDTCDPGFESRDDLKSVEQSALAGGFTTLAIFPNTQPALHSKSELQYILTQTKDSPVRFLPIGALSQGCEGKDLAELYDLHQTGAIAFSDGHKSVQDAGLLLRAMQYTKAFKGLIINQPLHKSIAAGGQMNEGIHSTMLGLKGIPVLAEELMIQRDLSLMAYAESPLHIHLVSSAKGVELIRAAKKAGLPVTCSVAIANLCFTDEKLLEFDSLWKIMPPLRTPDDRMALVEGILDGTIDIICTNHIGWDEESKNLEFPYAEFGMIGLETCYPLYNTYLATEIPITRFVEAIAIAPRKILGLDIPTIKIGEKADLTCFLPNESYQFTKAHILSKSFNSPFIGETLKGKVLNINQLT